MSQEHPPEKTVKLALFLNEKRERDEARAEVVKLRDALRGLYLYVQFGAGDCGDVMEVAKKLLEEKK